MAQEKAYIKRRHYFINKGFQSGFILKFCLLILLGVVISTCLLFLFSRDTLTSSFDRSRLVIENTAVAILPAAVYTSLITLGLISIAAIFVTLFVSHKLAGPMYRFEEDLKEIGSGDLTKVVRLRKKDQFMALVESLNLMTGNLREKVRGIQEEVDRLGSMASEKGAPPELASGIHDLSQKISSNFKT